MKPCGTEAAYYRHRYRGETPCPEDVQAVAQESRRRAREKGVPPLRKAKHGTTSKYVAGCRCAFCRDAQTEYMRTWRAGKPKVPTRRERKAWLMRMDILDRLEMEGWVSTAMLAMEHGASLDSVERVLRRLRAEGLVVSRRVDLAYSEKAKAMESRTEWRVVSVPDEMTG